VGLIRIAGLWLAAMIAIAAFSLAWDFLTGVGGSGRSETPAVAGGLTGDAAACEAVFAFYDLEGPERTDRYVAQRFRSFAELAETERVRDVLEREAANWESGKASWNYGAQELCLDVLYGISTGPRSPAADRTERAVTPAPQTDQPLPPEEHDWAFDDAYERAFIKTIREVDAMRDLLLEIGPDDPRELADAMQEQVPQLEEMLQTFSSRTAPEAWQEANSLLVAGLTKLHDGWEMVIATLRLEGPADGIQAGSTLITDGVELLRRAANDPGGDDPPDS
jgi:hypothetical protein